MEYNLEKINAIKNRLAQINSDVKPPIVLLYKEGTRGTELAIPLTEIKGSRDHTGTFYICSSKAYEDIDAVYIGDSYYLCESLEDVETIATYLVEHYIEIFDDAVKYADEYIDCDYDTTANDDDEYYETYDDFWWENEEHF